MKEPWQMTKTQLKEVGYQIDEFGYITKINIKVPTNKLVFTEEKPEFYKARLGTPFETKSRGKLLELFYNPQDDTYHIINGHHRAIEAIEKGEITVMANVSEYNIERGFGTMTHQDYIQKALSEGKPVPPEVLKDYPDLVASVPYEPVKGEQAGMLGVPGKYVEQKRPWTPGQVEIESYVKYKKAMESPEEELDRKLREFERKTLKEEQAKEAKELEKILSGMMGKKRKSKVEAEAMKQAEKPSKNLYWYSVVELKKMCQNKGLSTEGSKESLIRRLK